MAILYHVQDNHDEGWHEMMIAKHSLRELAEQNPVVAKAFQEKYGHPHTERSADETSWRGHLSGHKFNDK